MLVLKRKVVRENGVKTRAYELTEDQLDLLLYVAIEVLVQNNMAVIRDEDELEDDEDEQMRFLENTDIEEMGQA